MVTRPRISHRIVGVEGGALSAGTWQDQPCVVLEAPWAVRRIERIAQAHHDIAHAQIAAVLALDATASPPLVAFDCAAVTSLELLVDAALASDLKIGFPAAVAFSDTLLDVLEAVHAAGYHVGSLAWRNVLVAPDGRWWLFAADDNPYLEGQAGAAGLAMAPEVALGAAPSTAGDAYAQFALVRSLLPCVALYEGYERAIVGAEQGAIIEALQRLTATIVAAPVGERIDDIPALRERYRAFRELDPMMPQGDHAALVAAFADLVERARDPRSGSTEKKPDTPLRIRVADRRLFRGEQCIDLRERRLLWRVWQALWAAHQREASLSVDRCLREAWPGERVSHDAGRARVYVAMSTLRKLGLADLIERDEDGYRLAAGAHITTDVPP